MSRICDPLHAVCLMLLDGSASYAILSIAERIRHPDEGQAEEIEAGVMVACSALIRLSRHRKSVRGIRSGKTRLRLRDVCRTSS